MSCFFWKEEVYISEFYNCTVNFCVLDLFCPGADVIQKSKPSVFLFAIDIKPLPVTMSKKFLPIEQITKSLI